jgi:hypothetical protein
MQFRQIGDAVYFVADRAWLARRAAAARVLAVPGPVGMGLADTAQLSQRAEAYCLW